MRGIKYYLRCPKCKKTIKLQGYRKHPEQYEGHDTICCYPYAMEIVNNEQAPVIH
jgi:hypothetical protein